MDENTENKKDRLTFFFRSKTVDNFKYENERLKKLIQYHVKPKLNSKIIKIRSFYKPLKLHSLLSERVNATREDKSHVVYQFLCNKDGYNSSYIGYTTNSLKLCVSQRRYKHSKIFEHLNKDHEVIRPNLNIFYFNILHRAEKFFDLRLAESLLIKKHKPVINIKLNEMGNYLNIF